MQLSGAKMAQQIEVLLPVEIPGEQKNTVLDGSLNIPHRFNAAFAKSFWPLVRDLGACVSCWIVITRAVDSLE